MKYLWSFYVSYFIFVSIDYLNDTISESSIIASCNKSSLSDFKDSDEGYKYVTNHVSLENSVTTCSTKYSSYLCNSRQRKWLFSVAFSHVWAVPALYLCVQYLSRMSLARTKVLNILKYGVD